MTSKVTRFTLDMEPVFQRRLKVMAAIRGVTMRQYCLSAIERELLKDEGTGMKALPFGEEALQRLADLRREIFQERTLPGDSTDLIRESREDRAS